MSPKQRTLTLVAGLLVIVAVFGSGYAAGQYGATHPKVSVGDGYVGADVATFTVGDTSYGFRSSVSWTDQAGSWHDSGWPACLPKLQTVTGVHFVGETVWAGNVGQAQVVWVDCQGR